MLRKRRYILASLVFICCPFLMANEPNSQTNHSANNPAPAPILLPNMEFVKQTCPPVDQLTKGSDLIWRGPHDWRSYSESFTDKIDHFDGAQWQGVNIGKIICVYTGKGRLTFPIMLERETAVAEPTGSEWSVNKEGYKNCNANKVEDCSFLVEKEKKVKNVYDEIDFYKGVKDTDSDF